MRRDCWCAPGCSDTCGKRFGWQLGDLPRGYDHKYTCSNLGYNLKVTDLQAAIGLAQTDKIEILTESRVWHHYDLPAEVAGGMWGGRYRVQRQKWFALRFLGDDADINIATEHPEFDAWQWVAPVRLPELIVPFKRQLYIDILTEFHAYCAPLA